MSSPLSLWVCMCVCVCAAKIWLNAYAGLTGFSVTVGWGFIKHSQFSHDLQCEQVKHSAALWMSWLILIHVQFTSNVTISLLTMKGHDETTVMTSVQTFLQMELDRETIMITALQWLLSITTTTTIKLYTVPKWQQRDFLTL